MARSARESEFMKRGESRALSCCVRNAAVWGYFRADFGRLHVGREEEVKTTSLSDEREVCDVTAHKLVKPKRPCLNVRTILYARFDCSGSFRLAQRV